MGKTFFVILLVTGLFATSVSLTYYYYSNLKTWNDGNAFCKKYHKNLLQDDDKFDWSTVGKSKAWIGIYKSLTLRSWSTGAGLVSYFNWSSGGESDSMFKLCTFIRDGGWTEHNCSDLKQSVCSNGSHYAIETTLMSWNDASTNCKNTKSFLVKIPNSTINEVVRDLLPKDTEAWIGLYKTTIWYSTTGYIGKENWETGQPDNFKGNEFCVAMNMTDGKWTDEPCADLYPFICNDADNAKQRVMKLKLQTTADLEDPVVTASLKQQLGVMLSKRGVSTFKLSWKKLPVKERDQKGSP